MASQEYYSDLIQLNTLKAQLKQKYKKQKANEKSTAYIKENLSPLLTDYFALLEQDFDGKISVQKMLKIASDLPEFDDTQLFGENKIAERYSELNAVLENLRNEEREILLKIKNIDNAFDTGSSFTQMLKDLKQQTSIAEIETDEYTCPLCGHECKEIAEKDTFAFCGSFHRTDRMRYLGIKYLDFLTICTFDRCRNFLRNVGTGHYHSH